MSLAVPEPEIQSNTPEPEPFEIVHAVSSAPEVEQPAEESRQNSSDRIVQFCKMLSDPTRLKIMQYLSQNKELHVTALCDLLNQSQPAVSHHLALLRSSSLISPRRDGKHNFYSVCDEHIGSVLTELSTAIGVEPTTKTEDATSTPANYYQ